MNCFGLSVAEVSIDKEGMSPYVDVVLAPDVYKRQDVHLVWNLPIPYFETPISIPDFNTGTLPKMIP